MLIRSVPPRPRARRLADWCRRLVKDRTAGTTALAALALPVVVGSLGIGVDVSSWYIEKRKLQQIADAAALGGARLKAADQSDSVVVTVATRDAARNGYSSTTHTLEINTPPLSGAYVEHVGAVEAIVTTQLKTLFSRIALGSAPRTLSARSVGAVKVVSDGEIRTGVCMLALMESGEKAIFLNGSGKMMAHCSMATHSEHARAMYLNGSGMISAYVGFLPGGSYYVNGSGSIVLAAGVRQTKVEDPHADLAPPDAGACDKTSFVASGNTTISPGRYCNGILNSGSGTLTLEPGTYVIDGGDVTNSGSGSIVTQGGGGVTLVFTATQGRSIGGLFSNGSGRIVLPAQSNHPDYPGIVVFQDRAASSTAAEYGVYLTGSSGDQVSGVIYTPKRTVLVNGTSTVSGLACMSIVARRILLNGSGAYEVSDCSTMGAELPKPQTLALVLVE